MTLSAIKASVAPGGVYDVTNHYIKRADHPCYGTNRREVTKTRASAFWLSPPAVYGEATRIEWPKAAQVQRDDDGTIRLYGGGVSQAPDELFLTLVPVRD